MRMTEIWQAGLQGLAVEGQAWGGVRLTLLTLLTLLHPAPPPCSREQGGGAG